MGYKQKIGAGETEGDVRRRPAAGTFDAFQKTAGGHDTAQNQEITLLAADEDRAASAMDIGRPPTVSAFSQSQSWWPVLPKLSLIGSVPRFLSSPPYPPYPPTVMARGLCNKEHPSCQHGVDICHLSRLRGSRVSDFLFPEFLPDESLHYDSTPGQAGVPSTAALWKGKKNLCEIFMRVLNAYHRAAKSSPSSADIAHSITQDRRQPVRVHSLAAPPCATSHRDAKVGLVLALARALRCSEMNVPIQEMCVLTPSRCALEPSTA